MTQLKVLKVTLPVGLEIRKRIMPKPCLISSVFLI